MARKLIGFAANVLLRGPVPAVPTKEPGNVRGFKTLLSLP